MRKALTYSSFTITTLLVMLTFLTAKTYAQLGIAIALYPLLAFFAFKVFPAKTVSYAKETKIENQSNSEVPSHFSPKTDVQTNLKKNDATMVVDLDRRAFLKLIGGTGLSIFLFTILGRRVENFVFNEPLDSRTLLSNSLPKNITNSTQSSESITDGYKISEIEDGIVSYYGFVNATGGWLIMREDADTNSYRYAKGNSDFVKSWSNRKDLNYDYFHNL